MRSRSAVVRGTPPKDSASDQFYPPATKPAPQPKASDVPAIPPAISGLKDPTEPVEEPDYDFPVLGGGFDRIVSRVYAIDTDKEYDELVAGLQSTMQPSRSDYGTIVDALDVAEDCARRAMMLFVNAKVTDKAFELDSLAITGAMRKDAVAALNAEKVGDDGKPIKGMKAITNDDVTAYISSQWADQWRRIELDREKSKRMCEYLERLAELWKQRARDLGIMASNARG